ncbi:methylamine utilization protein MauJ [Limnohabitans sp. JirII-31]|uniref:methylamine utilization protein MauJ n=1 Tax=Limnohabitans sp. JirII-31 TaxID=1977908 RepID=UPI001179C0EE|nr:methylamine utilization protein MauJ [Limnohabitans sp. JirII-31]
MIYLPTDLSKDAELALALYREGLSVNSVPFAFLSLFKVLNIRFGAGAGQEQWINSNIHRLWYNPAVDRLTELRKTHHDIGNYLYVQGRCAVAHAHSSPLVNPDEYAERRRLESDMPLLKELVALFIEQELGVLSDSSFHHAFDPKLHAGQALMRGNKQEGWILYEPFK